MKEFKASGATLSVYETKIVIKRHGVMSFLNHGSKGDKEIFIKNITAIQIKKPGFSSGFIQFSISGEKGSKGGVFEAVKDENSIIIGPNEYPEFVKAKELIESYVNGTNKPVTFKPTETNYSVADELIKLGALRDNGILTEEEFQQQKKRILG